MCNEIVYKNDKGNCISNDTGILTVSSRAIPQPSKQRTDQGDTFEIELDYFQAVEEQIEKFDQHLCANIASVIETALIAKMRRYKKQECVRCIDVFEENLKFQDEFLTLQAGIKPCREPCQSTVNIIKASNKIFDILEEQTILVNNSTHHKILRTIMFWLECDYVLDELYPRSNFQFHCEEPDLSVKHKSEFIRKIINEYMNMKASKVGSRITQEERGKYIRHSNKKRVQEAGQ